ncbi:MAG: hypothetical protein K1X75_14695 [Leptospirales bacterium]|nr:hypothetical protein [Leptospirales bacterium]
MEAAETRVYQVLAESWPWHKRRTLRRSILAMAIVLVISIGFIALVFSRSANIETGAVIFVAVVGVVCLLPALAGGIAFGLYISKSTMKEMRIELSASQLRFRINSFGGPAIRLDRLQSVTTLPDGALMLQANRKLELPPFIENKEELLATLKEKARPRSAG